MVFVGGMDETGLQRRYLGLPYASTVCAEMPSWSPVAPILMVWGIPAIFL
jgi:hypothetical protein